MFKKKFGKIKPLRSHQKDEWLRLNSGEWPFLLPQVGSTHEIAYTVILTHYEIETVPLTELTDLFIYLFVCLFMNHTF